MNKALLWLYSCKVAVPCPSLQMMIYLRGFSCIQIFKEMLKIVHENSIFPLMFYYAERLG